MCVTECQEGFYADIRQECEPCHHECRSCGGPYYDDCDSCEDDRRLVNGECVSKSKAIHCNPLHFLNGEATPSCELVSIKHSRYVYPCKFGEPHEYVKCVPSGHGPYHKTIDLVMFYQKQNVTVGTKLTWKIYL